MLMHRKAVSIVLGMTSIRNVEEIAIFLQKHLQKTQEADYLSIAPRFDMT